MFYLMLFFTKENNKNQMKQNNWVLIQNTFILQAGFFTLTNTEDTNTNVATNLSTVHFTFNTFMVISITGKYLMPHT